MDMKPVIPKTCKAAVLVEHNAPNVIQDVEIPELAPGSILCKVRLAGVCGTDVHLAKGDLEFKPPLPNILGHETLGEVVALGEGRVKDVAGRELKPGDRIMWAHAFCGECYYCKIERKPYMCIKNRGYGTANPKELRGGFAEYVYIDAKTEVVHVPDTVLDEEALGVGCAMRSVVNGFERLNRYSPINVADTVVVQGCGPIGLYATLLAANSGAGQVITIGAPAGRLELAREWGATHTINIEEITSHEERVKMVMELTEGRGAEVAIEGAGFAEAFNQGFDFLCKGSTYLILGQTSSNTITFAPTKFLQKQCVVIGSGMADIRHFYKALKFVEATRDRIDYSKMLSSTYKLEEINEALANMKKGVDIKGAIDNRDR